MDRIILFDGECNVCNAAVQFILKRDTKKLFSFASKQSPFGQKLLKENNVDETIDSMILFEGDSYFDRTTAALKISKELSGFRILSNLLLVIPRSLRDPFYKGFAKNRYRLFGKANTCLIPSKEDRERFLS